MRTAAHASPFVLHGFQFPSSGTKIANSLADLAYFAKLPLEQVQPILAMLTAPQARVLRAIVTSGDGTERHEIFHDVLGEAILDWRAPTSKLTRRNGLRSKLQNANGKWLGSARRK